MYYAPLPFKQVRVVFIYFFVTLSRGAQSVKCAACNYVTAIGSSSGASSSSRGGALGSHMVVVENPPTLDEKGKIVSNMAVGVVEEVK